MKVKNIMVTEVTTLRMNEELRLADDIMSLGRIRHLPVVDNERLVGIISQRDLFKASLAAAMGFEGKARRDLLGAVAVREVMISEVLTISPESDLKEAVRIMLENKIGCLPVVEDNNKMVGLITETDILRQFIS